MGQPLSGTGIGLQVPQSLYPTYLAGGEVQPSTNVFTLAPGEAIPVPAGRWVLDVGKYGALQYLDPVTNIWTILRDNSHDVGSTTIWSDGFNVRIANLTSCVVGAVVTNGGNGAYAQATTTVTPSIGNSVWQAVIGGAINTTVSVTAAGSGYGIAPLVFIDAPTTSSSTPDAQATAVAVLSSGSVSSITVINQGAGYPSAPNITILPNPADPNINSTIVNATATCSLTGTGSVTAVICTNPGAPVASVPTLAIAGSGASAAATALVLNTITAASVTAAGAGYGAAASLTTVGGNNTVASPTFTNPLVQFYDFIPRAASVVLGASTSITSIGSIIDGGLFLSTPTALAVGVGIVSSLATIGITLGGANTTIRMQQVA